VVGVKQIYVIAHICAPYIIYNQKEHHFVEIYWVSKY
jgi:hypothetical protein